MVLDLSAVARPRAGPKAAQVERFTNTAGS